MNNDGYFGEYGGCFAPEILIAPLQKLSQTYFAIKQTAAFQDELQKLLKDAVGRPTPLYFAKRLSEQLGGARIYLKREDLAHTGAHKINNCLGQGLLAKIMGKKRIIAETGAGQSGVAAATVASMLGLECTVYMGAHDMARQAPNVVRMRLLGALVVPVTNGSQGLKDATSEALRAWVSDPQHSYYMIGSALGPHPYPTIVRDFQSVIGIEARSQILAAIGRLPTQLIACVGGGSNAIGLFHPFLNDLDVRMTGVEAGGIGLDPGQHAARFATGKPGVLHGSYSYLLQNEHGQVASTHSISAGLDYPGVGPELAFLHDSGRVQFAHINDQQALEAAKLLALFEGIIPALESSHALAYAMEQAKTQTSDHILLVNLSGRGDKDLATYTKHLEEK